MRSRRSWRSFRLLVALFFLVGAACRESPPDDGATQPLEPVELTQAGLLPFFPTVWPTVIAKSEGFFEQRGLDVSFVWGFEGPRLFAGGQSDIMLDSGDGGLLVFHQGVDSQLFYPLSTRVSGYFVARNDFHQIEDLRGGTIGQTDIPSTDQFLNIGLLESQGLSADEVDFVRIDPAQALPAIDAGRIDAMQINDVFFPGVRDDPKYTTLGEPEDYGSFPWTLLVARGDFIEANPDTIAAYTEAVAEATQFILDPTNKEAVVDAVSEEADGFDKPILEAAYDLVLDTPSYYADRPLTPADLQPAVEVLRFQGLLEESETPDLEAFLNMEFFSDTVSGP